MAASGGGGAAGVAACAAATGAGEPLGALSSGDGASCNHGDSGSSDAGSSTTDGSNLSWVRMPSSMRTRKTSSHLLNTADGALIKVASFLGSADFMALTATCRYARSLANDAAAYEGCVWPLVRRGPLTPATAFMDYAMDTVYSVQQLRHLVAPVLAFHAIVAGVEVTQGPTTGPLGPVATCVSGLAGMVLDAIDVTTGTEPLREELVRQAVILADAFAHALLHLQDAIVAGVYDAHTELKVTDGGAEFATWLARWAQQYKSLVPAAHAMITGELPVMEGGKVGLDAEVVLGTADWAADLMCMDYEDEAEGATKWGHLVDAYASSLFTGYMLDRCRRLGARGRALPCPPGDASRRQAAFHAAMATVSSDADGGSAPAAPVVHTVADVTAIVAATGGVPVGAAATRGRHSPVVPTATSSAPPVVHSPATSQRVYASGAATPVDRDGSGAMSGEDASGGVVPPGGGGTSSSGGGGGGGGGGSGDAPTTPVRTPPSARADAVSVLKTPATLEAASAASAKAAARAAGRHTIDFAARRTQADGSLKPVKVTALLPVPGGMVVLTACGLGIVLLDNPPPGGTRTVFLNLNDGEDIVLAHAVPVGGSVELVMCIKMACCEWALACRGRHMAVRALPLAALQRGESVAAACRHELADDTLAGQAFVELNASTNMALTRSCRGVHEVYSVWDMTTWRRVWVDYASEVVDMRVSGGAVLVRASSHSAAALALTHGALLVPAPPSLVATLPDAELEAATNTNAVNNALIRLRNLRCVGTTPSRAALEDWWVSIQALPHVAVRTLAVRVVPLDGDYTPRTVVVAILPQPVEVLEVAGHNLVVAQAGVWRLVHLVTGTQVLVDAPMPTALTMLHDARRILLLFADCFQVRDHDFHLLATAVGPMHRVQREMARREHTGGSILATRDAPHLFMSLGMDVVGTSTVYVHNAPHYLPRPLPLPSSVCGSGPAGAGAGGGAAGAGTSTSSSDPVDTVEPGGAAAPGGAAGGSGGAARSGACDATWLETEESAPMVRPCTLPLGTAVTTIAAVADGRQLYAAAADGTIYLLCLPAAMVA